MTGKKKAQDAENAVVVDKPRKMGRPKLEIDQEQYEALCRLNPTLKDMAAFFKCSEDTIENKAKEFGYATFSDARQQNMVHTRLNLIRTAVSQASSGNVPMLIFSLKNLCGWADKQDTSIEVVDKTETEELLKEAKTLIKQIP
jgi:hypothetical protein